MATAFGAGGITFAYRWVTIFTPELGRRNDRKKISRPAHYLQAAIYKAASCLCGVKTAPIILQHPTVVTVTVFILNIQ